MILKLKHKHLDPKANSKKSRLLKKLYFIIFHKMKKSTHLSLKISEINAYLQGEYLGKWRHELQESFDIETK